jgi:hypothetical protein
MRPLSRTILLSVLLTISATASAGGLEDLEQRIARTPPVSTGFVEYRFSHLLKKPLRTAGKLEYRADGTLARAVDDPYRELTEVNDDTVRMQRGDKAPRTIPLQRAPQIRVLLGSFRALLEGKLTPLQNDFNVTLVEDAPRWTLTLEPKDPKLAKHLARIAVHGHGDHPFCLEATEPDGDGALTLFVERAAAPAGAQTRAGLETLCRAAPSARTTP